MKLERHWVSSIPLPSPYASGYIYWSPEMKTSSLSAFFRQLRPAPRPLLQTRPLLCHPHLSYALRRNLVQPSKPLGFLDKSNAKPLGVTGKAKNERPSYLIQFTCKPCGTRSTHQISKQGYISGSILVTCPSCKNRHVISDHLKVCTPVWFSFCGPENLHSKERDRKKIHPH